MHHLFSCHHTFTYQTAQTLFTLFVLKTLQGLYHEHLSSYMLSFVYPKLSWSSLGTIQNNGPVSFVTGCFFLLTIPKCFPLTLSFVLSDFLVVSIGGNDTANHFKMISALGGGISFLFIIWILEWVSFFPHPLFSLRLCRMSHFLPS